MIDKVLSTIMTLVAEKKLHVPQPFQVFGIAEVESVFRLLQSGQNSGKMVIEMRSQDLVPVRPPKYPSCLRVSKTTDLSALFPDCSSNET